MNNSVNDKGHNLLSWMTVNDKRSQFILMNDSVNDKSHNLLLWITVWMTKVTIYCYEQQREWQKVTIYCYE